MLTTKTKFAAIAAALAALILPASALGATATTTGTVSGSTLSLSTSATPSFTANLDNGDSTPTYTIPMSVQDTRGTGVGWAATITSTQFTTGAPNNYTLATTASSLTGVTSANGTGTDTAPTNQIAYPLAVPAASGTLPTAVKLFDANVNTGMGKFTITPTIGVNVPQNTYAGTYTSNLTLAIVTGP